MKPGTKVRTSQTYILQRMCEIESPFLFLRFTEIKMQTGSTRGSLVVDWATCRVTWCLRSRWRTRRPGSSSCSRASCPLRPPWRRSVWDARCSVQLPCLLLNNECFPLPLKMRIFGHSLPYCRGKFECLTHNITAVHVQVGSENSSTGGAGPTVMNYGLKVKYCLQTLWVLILASSPLEEKKRR